MIILFPRPDSDCPVRIKYNLRSGGFRDQAESILKDRGDSLDAGDPVVVDFGGDYEYREEEFLLSVSADENDDFLTDWWKGRTDLFPARAKAAATALRDLGLFGSYRFRNLKEGLEVTKRGETELPYRSFSWDVLSEEVADKKMDRSTFLHNGYQIPAGIHWFFGISKNTPFKGREVTLVLQGKSYKAKTPSQSRDRFFQLTWHSDFANALKEALPNFHAVHEEGLKPNQDCWMRFVKTSESNYEIKLCTEKGDDKVRGAGTEKKGSGRVPVTGYWTLISNPKYWPEIFEILEGDLEVCGNKLRYADVPFIGPGLLGVVRITTDQRSAAQRKGDFKREAGVYAVVEITSDPYLRQQTEVNQGKDYGVDYRFIKKFAGAPLTADDLRENEDITDKYVLNPIQASSIPLNKETFDALVRLADAEVDLDLGLEKTVAKTPKRDLPKKFRKASPKLVERVSKRYERGSEGEEVKKRAGRKCQINEAMGLDPYSFRKSNGEHYCEAHHVVPVSSGEEGVLHPSNVVCVSADRHRQLHYGNAELVEIRDDEFEFLIEGETVIVPKLILDD